MSVHVRFTQDGQRRYDVRLRDPSGRGYTRTFRTRREAEAFERKELVDRARGAWLDPRRADTTVRQVAGEWLESNPAKRPTTLAKDESALRVQILPAIGDRQLGSLSPGDIQKCVNEWSKRLSPRSVRRIYGTLRAVLNHAVLEDYVARSPARGINLPEVQPVERPEVAPDQLHRVAEALGEDYQAMVYLGAVLGLRWGECAGLRIGRIDFDLSTITIAEQLTRGIGGRSVIGPPKSTAGRRTLAAPADLMSLLETHMRHQGITREDVTAFLFVGPHGDHLDYANWLHRIWYPARKKADLDWIQFHDLRRANATGLVLEGVDIKTAQARLGHTDPRLTLGVYARATTEADRAAAKKLGERFLGATHDRPAPRGMGRDL
jgi:integrase